MAYTKSNPKSFQAPARISVPTPQGASHELHQSLVESFTAHFAKVLTPELMIAHRKGAYATVINATTGGKTLEELLGTDNAKLAVEQILNDIQSAYSVVPIR